MKKILALILSLMLVFTFAGCGEEEAERILYVGTDFSEILELGDYESFTIDTKSDEYMKYYNGIITSDVSNNNFYVKKTEGTIVKGDTANIDYVGKKDGVAFEGGTASNYDLKIGSGTFIPGFEDGLIGATIGSTIDLNLTFPEDYKNSAELAGKSVVFTVTINYATTETEQKPEEFYEKLEFASLKEYEADVKERAIENYLLLGIVNNTKIKGYPQDDIEILFAEYKESVEQQLQTEYGMTFANYLSVIGQSEDQFKSGVIENTIKPMMKYQMPLYAILDAEGMKITQAEVDAKVQELIDESGNDSLTPEVVKENYGAYYFENLAVSEKILNFLLERTTVK